MFRAYYPFLVLAVMFFLGFLHDRVKKGSQRNLVLGLLSFAPIAILWYYNSSLKYILTIPTSLLGTLLLYATFTESSYYSHWVTAKNVTMHWLWQTLKVTAIIVLACYAAVHMPLWIAAVGAIALIVWTMRPATTK